MDEFDIDQLKLPEELDIPTAIISFRFGMMLNYLYGYEKRFEMCKKELRDILIKSFGTNERYIEKVTNKIIKYAQYGYQKNYVNIGPISSEFWNTVEIFRKKYK